MQQKKGINAFSLFYIIAGESPTRRGEGGGVRKGGPLWSPARPPLMNIDTFRFSILAFLLVVSMLLLAACGSGSNGSSSSSTSSASVSSATPTQDANHVSLAKLVGAPTAKITSGTNFEVTGRVQNLDKSQHDIYLQATLKNASGRVVGIARGLADNVAAGNMDTYTLQGTLMQPAWSTVVVVITKVSENVNGQGSD